MLFRSIANKIKSGEIVNLRYQTRTFKNGKGIVITNLDHKILNKPTDMTKIVNNVNEWVAESIKNGVVLEQMLFNIQKIYQSNMQLLKGKASSLPQTVTPLKQQKYISHDNHIVSPNSYKNTQAINTGTH